MNPDVSRLNHKYELDIVSTVNIKIEVAVWWCILIIYRL